MTKVDENFQLNYNPETNTLKCNDEKLVCPLCGRHNKLHIMSRSFTNDDGLEVWVHCDECGLEFDAVVVGIYNKQHEVRVYDCQDDKVWTILFLDSHNHSVSKCFKTRCGRNSIGYLLGKLNKVCKEGDSYIAIIEVE